MACLILLAICLLASLVLGAAEITPKTVYEALTQFDNSTEHLIVRTVRLPRSLIAICVGAALAVAGSLIQGITQNPLASPSLLGINAGASFAVVLATLIFQENSLQVYALFAFLGAGITAASVYILGSFGKGGLTPLNVILAGAALTAFLAAMTSGILIVSQRTLDEIRFWLAGSVAGRDLKILGQVLPYFIIGLILALVLSKAVTTLSLGDSIAQGLGQSTELVKLSAGISIILLAGTSVAIAGPISFIGLIVPHFARFWIGYDYRFILPYAALLGAILLLTADIAARSLFAPLELPVGLVMPLIGAPFFIYLARWQIKK
ncbi:MAG: FecCD family ABC transporter permease [Spirulinaceae cyanobacterium]